MHIERQEEHHWIITGPDAELDLLQALMRARSEQGGGPLAERFSDVKYRFLYANTSPLVDMGEGLDGEAMYGHAEPDMFPEG